MSRPRLLIAVVLGTLLSACGTEQAAVDSPDASSAVDDAPVVLENGELTVGCGGDGAGWPPSVMTEGLQGALTDDEARSIFQGILSDPRTGGEAALSLFPDGVDVDWRVLHKDEDSLTIGLGRWTEQGPADAGIPVLGLERERGAWRAKGWGDCQLSPVLKEGNSWAEVTGYSGDAASARIRAQVSERECTSGRNPARFLRDPVVVETSETVTIYWTSDPATGGQDCQGTPSLDRVVELTQPLGSRVVFDGSTYPPRQVRAD